MTTAGKSSAPPSRASQRSIAATRDKGAAQGPSGTPAEEPSAKPASSVKPATSDKREAIMNAALSLFVERGFYGTAVPEIAERAGVGAGTIYRYFESKEALVNELYRTEKMRFAQNVVERVNANGTGREPARDLFKRLWLHMAEFAVDHPQSFVFLELHHHAAYLDAESRALEQRMLALFSGVIVAAQVRHELKAGDPKLLMGIVMGGFIGVIRGCMEWNTKVEDADWLFAERCMWEAIRA
ncbi:MAG TPA: TetR/AcrR family transcriptional regulator [Kofleriaceae bacterium]|nr:TetR/AcrR family transcriptional regulator [Kofleriaceae bacterium]